MTGRYPGEFRITLKVGEGGKKSSKRKGPSPRGTKIRREKGHKYARLVLSEKGPIRGTLQRVEEEKRKPYVEGTIKTRRRAARTKIRLWKKRTLGKKEAKHEAAFVREKGNPRGKEVRLRVGLPPTVFGERKRLKGQRKRSEGVNVFFQGLRKTGGTKKTEERVSPRCA